jgi:hypothetical protein
MLLCRPSPLDEKTAIAARNSDDRPQARASDIAFKLRDADLGSLIGLIPGRPRWSAARRFASLRRSEPMADDDRPLRRYPFLSSRSGNHHETTT